MSVSALTTVWCDEPGCSNWEAHEPTAAEARKEAKAAGWITRKGGKDFCPRHGGDMSRASHDIQMQELRHQKWGGTT